MDALKITINSIVDKRFAMANKKKRPNKQIARMGGLDQMITPIQLLRSIKVQKQKTRMLGTIWSGSPSCD